LLKLSAGAYTLKDRIRNLLDGRLLLFIGLSFSIVGLVQVLATILLVNSFPIDLIGIDMLNKIPMTPFFVPLLFWNLPLVLVLISRAIFKGGNPPL
jgi:hypothetical protein|tara:strand:- start:91 stop:378 length:288 start_codon:yes stop_codon:yes gene_type:complete